MTTVADILGDLWWTPPSLSELDAKISDAKKTTASEDDHRLIDLFASCYKKELKTDLISFRKKAAQTCYARAEDLFEKRPAASIKLEPIEPSILPSQIRPVEATSPISRKKRITELEEPFFSVGVKPVSIRQGTSIHFQFNAAGLAIEPWLDVTNLTKSHKLISGTFGFKIGYISTKAIPVSANSDFVFSYGGGGDPLMCVALIADNFGNSSYKAKVGKGGLFLGALYSIGQLIGTGQFDLAVGFRFKKTLTFKFGINPGFKAVRYNLTDEKLGTAGAVIGALGTFIKIGFEKPARGN